MSELVKLNTMRCLTISLNNLPEEYKIVLGYITYHSGKLYNQALYLLKNIEVEYISECFTSGVDSSIDETVCKENYTPEARIKRGLYKTKLLGYLNADINACRNFLKKLGKFDLISDIRKPVRLRIFHKLKSSSAVLPFGKIGRSRGGVNLPVVIRDIKECLNSPEALYL